MSQDLIQAPDFNNITCRDLEDDERLVHLYFQAVRADFWPNAGSHSVHTFVALAEKALQEAKDKHTRSPILCASEGQGLLENL